MREFKKGDRVVWTGDGDETHYASQGKKHPELIGKKGTVMACHPPRGIGCLTVKFDDGTVSGGWAPCRYDPLVEEKPPVAPAAPELRGKYLEALDHKSRKEHKILEGLLAYFPDACAYVSYVSYVGNEQHNPGQPMHWAREKSIGTGNEIVRHLTDTADFDDDGTLHAGKAAWRALELLQRKIEKLVSEGKLPVKK